MFFRGQIERRSIASPASLLGYSDRPVVVAINSEAIHIISSDSPSVSCGIQSNCIVLVEPCTVSLSFQTKFVTIVY